MSIYYCDCKKDQKTDPIDNIETQDPSLNDCKCNSLTHCFKLTKESLKNIFFSAYDIDYICNYALPRNIPFRIVTHPSETDTCFEKAELLGSWNPLNVIKALYFENPVDNSLYAVVIPETGCFLNRTRVRDLLELPEDNYLRKAASLPRYMSFGTCSPFVTKSDLHINGGLVKKIVFDSQSLSIKKNEQILDDFSFGLDHRMSLQINYNECFEMLREIFPDTIIEKDVMNLSFKEKLVRNNGKVSIAFEFTSLDYNTAKFINSIHGYGEVSILNDYLDELDDPALPKRKSSYFKSRKVFTSRH